MLHAIKCRKQGKQGFKGIAMNKVILCGRLTKDPTVTYTNGAESICVARYTLAVDRKMKKESEVSADFIQCVAFGRNGQFAEKWLTQGTKVIVTGHIRTGSYIDRDGKKIYTTNVEVEDQEFAESKNAAGSGGAPASKADQDGFMPIPDDLDDKDLPFN